MLRRVTTSVARSQQNGLCRSQTNNGGCWTRRIAGLSKSRGSRKMASLSTLSMPLREKGLVHARGQVRMFASALEELEAHSVAHSPPPFKKIMAANRGEIATRILRASAEVGSRSVAIYSHEDRFTQHRYKADEAFKLNSDKSPVGAYLDIDTIVKHCVENDVGAVHPGYGFLSENEHFAASLEANGVTFVGPTAQNLRTFGDKTAARELAIKMRVPVTPGTDDAVKTAEEARAYIEGPDGPGYPIIVKAAMGGGGRGMRVVEESRDLNLLFNQASNEAKSAFGDGRCFIERYVCI